jgi:hypothetical protein
MLMMFAALVLAQMFRLTVPQVLQQTPVAPDASRYHLSEFSDAVERDVERCICMTTRMSPATLKAEILLVSDCECGK